MNTPSLRIATLTATLVFIGIGALPPQAAASAPPSSSQGGTAKEERAMWMAEWVRPNVAERSIGVLTLRDGKLWFVEQSGRIDWEVDLASVKRVSTANGGRSLAIASMAGDEFIVSIMQPDLTHGSPKKALSLIERAVQSLAASSR